MDTDLKISERDVRGIPLLDLVGEVDAYTCSQFREALAKSLGGDNRDLIISMEGVEYIDSSGLGALVGGLKRAREKEGRICIVSCNPQVNKVFEITGLVNVFPVFGSLDEAFASLGNAERVAAS